MKLVSETTSGAVPKLYCSFQRKGTTYILMERIHGETIGRNWNCRTPESKADLLSQLRRYFDELRAIPHPVPGMVAAAGMTKLHDYRISPEPFGPFPNTREFHVFLRDGITASVNNLPEIEQMIQMQEENKYSVCFTHGAIGPTSCIEGNIESGFLRNHSLGRIKESDLDDGSRTIGLSCFNELGRLLKGNDIEG
jgi:hypothetical protein